MFDRGNGNWYFFPVCEAYFNGMLPYSRRNTFGIDNKSFGNEVKRIGSKTMLVGSDFGLFCLSFGIGMVAHADITESEKQDLLGLNALKMLERTGWFDRSMLRCTDRVNGWPGAGDRT